MTHLGAIPEDWETCSIGDVSILAQYGLSIRGQSSGRCPILRMNCQVDGEVSLRDLQYVELDDRTLEAFSLKRGDILFNRTNSFELVGRSAVFDHPLRAVFASYLVRLVVDRSRVDPHFLNFQINWDIAQRELKRLASRAVSQANISASKLKEFSVHLPGLREQQRIATVLRNVRDRIAAERKLEDQSKALKASTLDELFKRGLRGEAQKETEIGLVPESWQIVALGSLGKVGNGTTPNRTKTEYWSGGTVPWITSGRMYDRSIRDSEWSVTAAALEENSLPLLKPGAVLIAIVGQGKTLGHCAILEVEGTVSRHVGFVQPDETLAISEYIRGYLESRYLYLRQLASGNGSTRGALTCAILRSLRIPLPALDEQREMVAILDALDRKINVHRKKREVLEELFKSLLHRLMTGEIRVHELDASAVERQRDYRSEPTA